MAGESKLQSKIIKLIEKRGGYVIDVMASSKDGVHDLIACYKSKFISIEVKYGSNLPSSLQLAHRDLVRESGGVAIIVWEITIVEDYLDLIDKTRKTPK